MRRAKANVISVSKALSRLHGICNKGLETLSEGWLSAVNEQYSGCSGQFYEAKGDL